jgi:hypothetical protein
MRLKMIAQVFGAQANAGHVHVHQGVCVAAAMACLGSSSG